MDFIIKFISNLRVDALIDVLPTALTGWLSVFVVIIAIVLVVMILNKLSSK